MSYRFPIITILLVSLTCSLGWAQMAPLQNHPDSSDWQDLLAEDLSNCQFREGTWAMEAGALTRRGGDYLWTNDRYGDFILDLEYKVGEGANSGVFVRTGSHNDCPSLDGITPPLVTYGNGSVRESSPGQGVVAHLDGLAHQGID